MLRSLVAIAVSALLGSSAAEVGLSAPCPGRTTLPAYKTKPIFLMDDTLLFRSVGLEMDLDGSSRNYGVHDQGYDSICSGLAPREPKECSDPRRPGCHAACERTFRAWNGKPEDLGKTMCSIGLGGGDCSKPDVRIQPIPDQDWFVSETSVHPAVPAGTPVRDWVRQQAGQIDAMTIPYFVIPGGFRYGQWDATPGDVGIAYKVETGQSVAFIVGDTGGKLDEGSEKLLAGLKRVDRLTPTQAKNAFGVTVGRYLSGIEGDFRIAIFRHSGTKQPRDDALIILSLAHSDIQAYITRVSTERLARLGGIERIRDCSR